MPRITPDTTLTIEIDDMTRSGPTLRLTTSDQTIHSHVYNGDLDRASAASQLAAIATAMWARVKGPPAAEYVQCTAIASAPVAVELVLAGVVLTRYDDATREVTVNAVSPPGSVTLTLANVTEALRAAQVLSIGSRTASNIQLQQAAGSTTVEFFIKL